MCRIRNQTAKDTIRVTITNILKHAKPSKTSNIPTAQHKPLLDLKKDKKITILPADKGRAVVVMIRNDYEQKLNNLLSDTKTYEEIRQTEKPDYAHRERTQQIIVCHQNGKHNIRRGSLFSFHTHFLNVLPFCKENT